MKKPSTSPPAPALTLHEFNPAALATQVVDYFDRTGPGLSQQREAQAKSAIVAIFKRHAVNPKVSASPLP